MGQQVANPYYRKHIMAQLTIKEVTRKNDWYPCFATTVLFTAAEFEIAKKYYFFKAKFLKDGTVKSYRTGQTVGRNPSVEDMIASETKLLNYIGIEVK